MLRYKDSTIISKAEEEENQVSVAAERVSVKAQGWISFNNWVLSTNTCSTEIMGSAMLYFLTRFDLRNREGKY